MPRWGDIFGGALSGAGGMMSDLALRRMDERQQRQMREDRQREARTVAETLAESRRTLREQQDAALDVRAGKEQRREILGGYSKGDISLLNVNEILEAQGLDPVTTSGEGADRRVAKFISDADDLAKLPTESAALQRARDERALWPVSFEQPLDSFSPTYDQSVDPVTGRLSLEAAGPSRMDPEGPLVQNIRDLVGEQRSNLEKAVALQYEEFIAGAGDTRTDSSGQPLIAGVKYRQGRNFAGDPTGIITRSGLTLEEEKALAAAEDVTSKDPTAAERANAAALSQLARNHDAAKILELGGHVLPKFTAGIILGNPIGAASQILQNFTLTAKQQQYLVHSQSFATVVVQRLSGVQFRENEYGRYLSTLFATGVDDIETIAAKQRQRESFLTSIQVMSGKAADEAGFAIGTKMVNGELSYDNLDWMEMTPEFLAGLESAGVPINRVP